MKKYLPLALLLFSGSMIFSQNWENKPTGSSSFLQSVHFPTRSVGFAVGYEGTILKTIDEGETWSILDSGDQRNINAVFFTDVNIGYVAGWDFSNGFILKTINGGTDWSELISVPGQNFLSLYFVNDSIGYAVGGNQYGGLILKTTDSGLTWESQTIGLGQFSSVYFSTETYGIAVGANGTIEMTTNGSDWFEQWAGQYSYRSIYLLDSLIGYIVGNNCVLLKTTNGGFSWSPLNCPGYNNLQSLFFTDQDHGYIVGSPSVILESANGGVSWEDHSLSGIFDHFMKVFFTTQDTGFIVGYNGTILKTTNGGGVGINQNEPVPIKFRAYPNPTKDLLNVEIEDISGHATITLSKLNGQVLHIVNDVSTGNILDLRNYPLGIYLLKYTDEQTLYVRKIIKQ